MRRFLISLCFLFIATVAQAQNQPRSFPANAMRGKLTPINYAQMVIDGKTYQLSPVVKIYNRDNLIEMSGAIRGSDIIVNYTLDAMGNIERIWILTDTEAALARPSSTQ